MNRVHYSDLNKRLVDSEEYQSRGYCICCGERATYFNDSISRKEFEKTGLCQNCQDNQYLKFRVETSRK